MADYEKEMAKLLKTITKQLDSMLKYVGNISTEIERIRKKVT